MINVNVKQKQREKEKQTITKSNKIDHLGGCSKLDEHIKINFFFLELPRE